MRETDEPLTHLRRAIERADYEESAALVAAHNGLVERRGGDTATVAEWFVKALENTEKWGLQNTETLILAMTEELGEISQAHLENQHENGDGDRVAEELADLGALCIQLARRLERTEGVA